MSTNTEKWPTFLIKLMSRENVAERTMAFYFDKPGSFAFIPGQFIDIDLLNPAETDAAGNTRGFSISSPPHKATIIGCSSSHTVHTSQFKRKDECSVTVVCVDVTQFSVPRKLGSAHLGHRSDKLIVRVLLLQRLQFIEERSIFRPMVGKEDKNVLGQLPVGGV